MSILQCPAISMASVAGRRMVLKTITTMPRSLLFQQKALWAVDRHQVTSRPIFLGQGKLMSPTLSGGRHFHTTLWRLNSQAEAKATVAIPSNAEEEDPIQGSASMYHRHLLICTGTPSKDWPKKPELSDPYLNLLTTAVRSQNIKVNLSDVATIGGSSTINPREGPRQDVILFPDNVKFCQLGAQSFRDLDRFLAAHGVGTLRPFLEKTYKGQQHMTVELVPGVAESKVDIELVPERSAILVCTHGARDCRCGDRGGEMQRILKDMVEQTGLSSAVKVYGVSHIGGHKYAPNTIMYPSGDWHGNLSERDSVDAQQILFEALSSAAKDPETLKASEPIMLDKWRGRIGMSQDQQLKYYKEIQERQEQEMDGATDQQQQPQSLFAAIGEDLYQEDGLSANVDTELMHIEAKDELRKAQEKSSSTFTTTTATTPDVTESSSPQTINIVFESFQKVQTPIKAKIGERILDIVKDKDDKSRHDVYQALECTCGGELECATCHVYIESPFYERLPPVTEAEEDMLEYAIGRKPHSRLGCQIRMKPEYEGMVVKLPQY